MLTYEAGERVFMVYMRVPGIVLHVVQFEGSTYGYIVEVPDHCTEVFRLDEVDDYDPEKGGE